MGAALSGSLLIPSYGDLLDRLFMLLRLDQLIKGSHLLLVNNVRFRLLCKASRTPLA